MATVAAVAPAMGPDRGGTTVTITGVGFSGVTDVHFQLEDGSDDQPASDLLVSGDTQITCTTPQMAGEGRAAIVLFFGPDTQTLVQGGEYVHALRGAGGVTGVFPVTRRSRTKPAPLSGASGLGGCWCWAGDGGPRAVVLF